MKNPQRGLIVGLRVTAIVVMIVAFWLIWHVMVALPWQVDLVIAAIATVAFSYRFEREREGDTKQQKSQRAGSLTVPEPVVIVRRPC